MRIVSGAVVFLLSSIVLFGMIAAIVVALSYGNRETRVVPATETPQQTRSESFPIHIPNESETVAQLAQRNCDLVDVSKDGKFAARCFVCRAPGFIPMAVSCDWGHAQ